MGFFYGNAEFLVVMYQVFANFVSVEVFEQSFLDLGFAHVLEGARYLDAVDLWLPVDEVWVSVVWSLLLALLLLLRRAFFVRQARH